MSSVMIQIQQISEDEKPFPDLRSKTAEMVPFLLKLTRKLTLFTLIDVISLSNPLSIKVEKMWIKNILSYAAKRQTYN